MPNPSPWDLNLRAPGRIAGEALSKYRLARRNCLHLDCVHKSLRQHPETTVVHRRHVWHAVERSHYVGISKAQNVHVLVVFHIYRRRSRVFGIRKLPCIISIVFFCLCFIQCSYSFITDSTFAVPVFQQSLSGEMFNRLSSATFSLTRGRKVCRGREQVARILINLLS